MAPELSVTFHVILIHLLLTWLQVPAGAKRTEMVKLVKARREALPTSIVEVQGHLANARAAEEEALARKVGVGITFLLLVCCSFQGMGSNGKDFRIFWWLRPPR
jgi:hypothetical protein